MSVKAINCPNCGGSVELRGMAHSLSAVCVNCLSVLDASTPQVRVLQQFQEAARVMPAIPLGTRGKLDGHVWEVNGFQVRTITVEGQQYSWQEYLLFNPYQGFRYLSTYNGHWNFIRPLKGLPVIGTNAATVGGQRYKHFQSAAAVTTYAMGEFPWKVRVNDQVWVTDYVAPPRLLSREGTESETTWSVGDYREGAEIASAFQLRQALPPATGVFANQPNPHSVGTLWQTCLFLTIALFVVMIGFGLISRSERVFSHQYTYTGAADGDAVTSPEFDVGGRGLQNVEIHAAATLDLDWLYLGFLLVNANTGEAYIAGRELESESQRGNARDSVLFAQVPAGRYYLRVEPEMDKNSTMLRFSKVQYSVEVWRNVPHFALFWIAVPLMALPAIVKSFQKGAFETSRWQESDHAS